MRKLIVANIMSLDGYYEGPGKNVMVMPMGGAFDTYNAERLRAASTLLLGRVSYGMFRGFWPSVADDQSQEWSDANRAISRLENAIDKVVISDTLTADQTVPWQDTTRIIRRADAHAQIADLKKQPGKDILMFGSHTLWNDLLTHGLVDELHLMIGNVVIGGGTPIFSSKLDGVLKLIDIRQWPDSDNFYVQYAPVNK
jgi:dihydrofolate reductase